MLLMGEPEAIVETKLISSINNWFVSYQNSDPTLGLFQDSVIGGFEMTRTKTDGILKLHAMDMVSRCVGERAFKFDKPKYHSREIISKLLPPINYESRANFYVEQFTPYVRYRDDETQVKIVQGQLVQGVLDKASIGEGTHGGIFHTIYSEYGSHSAIRAIYNLQQTFNRFIYYRGITFGLRDVYLSKGGREKIQMEVGKIINASNEVTEKLNRGQLIPPLEMSVPEFYEEAQTTVLEHGDEFIKHLMEEIDTEDNWLYKIIFSGSKGKRNNLLSIHASLGSIALKGGRIPQLLDGRTTINFRRGDTHPVARGYCVNSFSQGISAASYIFAAMEARYELVETGLYTAVGGTMNRNAVKNLETIQVSNLRGSIKHNRLVQLLFGESGFDPRLLSKVQFPSVALPRDDFVAQFQTQMKRFDKKFQHKDAQKALDEEFKALEQDRMEFRQIMFKMESHMRRNFIMKDVLRMPVNPTVELRNIATLAQTESYKPQSLNPVEAIQMVTEFVNDLGYIYMNSIQRRKRAKIPAHLQNATVMLRILIRSCLSTSELLKYGADNLMLKQCLEAITAKLLSAFMDYGINVGVLAAECISEPVTQFLLDAKHRSGLKKEKTNMVVRFDEIMKNKSTEEMDNPQMLLIPREKYLDQKDKIVDIANHIEMLRFVKFVRKTQIFMESFGHPSHPDYLNEAKWITKFQALTTGEKVPTDLVNWCIRYELSQDDMILKNLRIRTIVQRINEKFPNLYVVYTPQSTETLVIRVYIRNQMFRSSTDINEDSVRKLNDQLLDLIIRGVPGIINANVISIAYTHVDPKTEAMEVRKMFAIETDGTNLSKILENPYLNVYECNTTSIRDIEYMYGIEAARNKIVDELQVVEKQEVNVEWATIYADEMTYTGRVTSIQRRGLGQREINQVFLRATFGDPIQVLQQAAVNNQTDHINTSMSAPLCVGTIPRMGTTYNDVFIDYDMIKVLNAEKTKANLEVLDEL
jgi:DNA-directed RNA polymerase II subunit RPB1